MSLVRLLEIGRSLNAIRDTQSRYRMQRENLLPKFGMAGSAATFHSMTADASSGGSGLGQRSGSATNLVLPGSEATHFGWAKAKHACEKPFSLMVGLFADSLKFYQGFKASSARKLKSEPTGQMALVNRKSEPIRPDLQPELSLDNVTVIRNDLNDADLQVIQLSKATGAGLAGQNAENAVSARPVNTAWERVKTRFLEVPIGYQDELGFHRGVTPPKKESGWPPFW